MCLGMVVERPHDRARENVDLLRGRMMDRDLPLERRDRRFRFALARNDREHIGDGRSAFDRRHRPLREPAVDRLYVLEPKQACQLARQH